MFHLNHPLCCRGGREGAARGQAARRREGVMLAAGQGPALGMRWEVLGVSQGMVLGARPSAQPVHAHSSEHWCLGRDSLGPEEAQFFYLNSKHHSFLWENLAVKMWSGDFMAFLSSLFP